MRRGPTDGGVTGERSVRTSQPHDGAASSGYHDVEVARIAELLESAARSLRSMPAPVARRSPRLLTVKDVAQHLAVSTRTVRRWRDSRVLPTPVRVQGVIRWTAESLADWIEERRRA